MIKKLTKIYPLNTTIAESICHPKTIFQVCTFVDIFKSKTTSTCAKRSFCTNKVDDFSLEDFQEMLSAELDEIRDYKKFKNDGNRSEIYLQITNQVRDFSARVVGYTSDSEDLSYWGSLCCDALAMHLAHYIAGWNRSQLEMDAMISDISTAVSKEIVKTIPEEIAVVISENLSRVLRDEVLSIEKENASVADSNGKIASKLTGDTVYETPCPTTTSDTVNEAECPLTDSENAKLKKEADKFLVSYFKQELPQEADPRGSLAFIFNAQRNWGHLFVLLPNTPILLAAVDDFYFFGEIKGYFWILNTIIVFP